MLAKGDYPFLIVVADFEYVGDTRKWLQILKDLAKSTRGNKLVAIQVRIKNKHLSQYQQLAEKAIDALGPDTRAVLNGNIDDARRFGYWGAHVSVGSFPDRVQASPALPFVSASVHCLDQLRTAESIGVSAVLCSPVFRPSWKDVDPVGLRGLGKLATASGVPTYALGGVTPAQCNDCVKAGAAGVAVLSGVLGAADPMKMVGEYLRCSLSSSEVS